MTESIYSENPQADILSRLAHYSYEDVLASHVAHRTGKQLGPDEKDDVASGIVQGIEYFRAASLVGVHTSPVQLYYGLVSLLRATVILMDGDCAGVEHHGMKLVTPVAARVGDVELVSSGSSKGALGVYAKAFAGQRTLIAAGQTKWTLRELIGSLPDLFSGTLRCYPDDVHSIPVERVRLDGGRRLDRLRTDCVSNTTELLARVERLSEAYLTPQAVPNGKHIVLRPKAGRNIELTRRALSGARFLPVAHQKTNPIDVPEVLALYMSLFIPCSLSRYHPRTWAKFIRTAPPLERELVGELLDVCARKAPNLLLNLIDDRDYVFTNQRITEVDARELAEASSVDELVKRRVQEAISELVSVELK